MWSFRIGREVVRRGALGAACLATLVACGGGPGLVEGPDPLANASSISRVPAPIGASDCDPVSNMRPLRSATEVRAAVAADTTIWARFPGAAPFPSGTPIQVAWRVNGEHGLSLVLVDDAGVESRVERVVPDPGIRWDRPGDAWSSTIEFAHPGCWRINVARGVSRRGDVWVEVS
jgi:hypothetical protein